MAKPPNSPRCQHILNTGRRCNGPAVHGLDFCHWHGVANVAQQTKNAPIPLLDDGNSIQLALTLTLRGIQSGEISPKQGTAMLYGLSIASYNLKCVRTDHEYELSPETTAAMRPLLGLPPLPAPSVAPPASAAPTAFKPAEPADSVAVLAPACDPTPAVATQRTAPSTPDANTEHTPACPITPVSDDPSADPPKFPPAHVTITPADREKMRKILRQGPSHPDFARCAQLLDAHISRKAGT